MEKERNKKEDKVKKKSKKSRKKKILALVITIVIVILCIVIGVIVFLNTKLKKTQLEMIEDISSKKIEVIQNVDGLNVGNVEAKVEEGKTKIYGTVTNVGEEKNKEMYVYMKIMLKNNEMIYIYAYIPEMKKNETKSINSEVNKELDNIDKIEITKIKN